MAGIAGLTGITHQLARFCPSNLVRLVRRARYGSKYSSRGAAQDEDEEDLEGRTSQDPSQDPPPPPWQHQGVVGWYNSNRLVENAKCGNCRDCKEKEKKKRRQKKGLRETAKTQLSIIDEVTEPGSKRGSGVGRALSIEEVMEDVEGDVGEEVEKEEEDDVDDQEEEDVGEDVDEEKRGSGVSSETDKGEDRMEDVMRDTWPVLLTTPVFPASPGRLLPLALPDEDCAGSRISGEVVNVYIKRGSSASCLSLPLGGSSSENMEDKGEEEVEVGEVEEEVNDEPKEAQEKVGMEDEDEEVRYSWPTSPRKESRDMKGGTQLWIIDEVTEPGSKRVSGVESTTSKIEKVEEEVEVIGEVTEEAEEKARVEGQVEVDGEIEVGVEVRDSWPAWPASRRGRLLEPSDDGRSTGSCESGEVVHVYRESGEVVHVYFGE
ncbi:hypothetical protein QBC32DRAFT_329632 [Pseudoneurospora amorphoporcata]|uniref:Uncharacterized protein n=1 Tax=Pseudoneurospora amorphoporcata TaxID=241081 RepID=A0AAN6P3X2_9PEZI|nr:hypothetical protein QBC32DRAFT_329632 [Pseudoneurospora amorphoporcata]